MLGGNAPVHTLSRLWLTDLTAELAKERSLRLGVRKPLHGRLASGEQTPTHSYVMRTRVRTSSAGSPERARQIAV